MGSEESVNHLIPKRVVMLLTGVEGPNGDFDEAVAALIDDAESRGLFFEWAAVGEMDINDVATGSPLHQALIGRFPDR